MVFILTVMYFYYLQYFHAPAQVYFYTLLSTIFVIYGVQSLSCTMYGSLERVDTQTVCQYNAVMKSYVI